ncbi:MAG: hypothetical protein M1546_01055 [Chloroflexi bacterium]|nr:hypothetical protein [Chloroflexota bacterium]
MPKQTSRRVVFQPATYLGFQRGINQIVEVIRPTLGPLPRMVAIEPTFRARTPELLDDGGVISRRITELPDRDEDMGAMFIRHVLWRLHEDVGDGTATAAVLFQSIYNRSLRYIVAGGNAMVFRHHLEKGLQLILDRLSGMTTRLDGKRQLAHVAESISHDHELAIVLGEVLDIIGEYGQLQIRTGRRREIEREYVSGAYWGSGLLSREMITDHTRLRTQIDNAAILISDIDIEDPYHLAPVLSAVAHAGIPGLLVIAGGVSERVTALLLVNRTSGKFGTIAVKTPGGIADRPGTLEDLAILTGGRPILKATGETVKGVNLQDLGRARRVWADASGFGIVGGKGDPCALRGRIASLRSALTLAEDGSDRELLRQRIGNLMGGLATLSVGGLMQPEVEARKELAKRTCEALRGVIREGVVPGGGVSLLACRSALQSALGQCTDPDGQAAYRVLIRALEEPTRTIITNAGFDAAEVMSEINAAGGGRGFDVISERVVHMSEAGIWDAAAVQKAVVHRAITATALALTIDVLVHRKKPPQTADNP